MKKTWETPRIMVEQFEANEYVAACWQLGCKVVGVDSDATYNPDGTQQTHGEQGCGNPANQYITDNGGTITVREKSADQGWLDCTITNYSSFDDVGPGTYVEWITSAVTTYNVNGRKETVTRTWHHNGVAGESYPGHPNRS